MCKYLVSTWRYWCYNVDRFLRTFIETLTLQLIYLTNKVASKPRFSLNFPFLSNSMQHDWRTNRLRVAQRLAYKWPPRLLTVPEFLIDPCVRKGACVPSGPSARPPLALWEGRASGWGRSQGTPLQGLVLGLALLTAVGRAPGVTATALAKVSNSQVLRTIVIVAFPRVPSLRLKGGGRGGLCEGDARDWDGARRGRDIPLAIAWPGHTHPGSSQAAGWRGSACNTIGEWGEMSLNTSTAKYRTLSFGGSINTFFNIWPHLQTIRPLFG